MAITIRRPAFYKISAVKDFIDRIEPRKTFWNRYVEKGSTVITFYGAGGVGKSALLKKLEKEIKHRNELTGKECKYVKYDFSTGTDMREVLKTLEVQLLDYGCEFPLFDTGNFYYSLKVGQNVTPPKVKSMLENLPWIQKMKKCLPKAGNVAGKAMPAVRTTKKLVNAVTDEDENFVGYFLKELSYILGETLPAMNTVTTFMSVADTLLLKYMESKKVFDAAHAEIDEQLNARYMKKFLTKLYEYLPILFAQDVTDWMTATGNKLVVILDNYESITGATVLQTSEQIKRDSWLRGLIFTMPDTLWTIAGRNKLCCDGELAKETKQHLITALSPEDSNKFLATAGITDENLRAGLVKLTEGYPIFLDLCVDVYTEYKRQNNIAPTIDEFGKKREEVVGRIFRYLDAASDDAGKDMLNFLCVLNVWTKELAVDIGKTALPNFSYSTYDRVKNFSFIQSECVKNEKLDLTVLNFDRTIQSILVATIDEKFISDVKTAVDNYFKKFFADKKVFDAKEIFYLKLWAEFIVRFGNDAETLREQYEDKLDKYVDTLIEHANFDAAEEILKPFMNKIETLNATDSVPYAYFKLELSRFRDAQGNYNEAYELAKAAYEKCSRLLGDEHRDTIKAMNNLALTLRDCGRYDEALTLQEKVLTLSKKIFGDEHRDTIKAMNNLAMTLRDCGRYDEVLTLQEKVLPLCEKILGEEDNHTIKAMNILAISLSVLGRYDEAIELQKKILTLRKKILGDEHPDTIKAMNNLAMTLRFSGRYDEASTMNEQVLTLRKKILGDKHPDTLMTMNNLANSLRDLGRYAEALNLQEKVLKVRKEILGDEHSDTVRSMQGFANSLSKLDRYDEALKLMEAALPLLKKIFGDEHPLTIIAMKNLAEILHDGGKRDEALALIERAATLAKEKLGEEHPETKAILDLREKILNG